MSKIVKFIAIKTVQKPTTVQFRTKSGELVKFKAIENIKERVPVKFRTKK
ncbi:MAG: hypothetical protein WC933_01550 [Candidatus Paceibacterota bacterium]|jgi:hypothetical protein